MPMENITEGVFLDGYRNHWACCNDTLISSGYLQYVQKERLIHQKSNRLHHESRLLIWFRNYKRRVNRLSHGVNSSFLYTIPSQPKSQQLLLSFSLYPIGYNCIDIKYFYTRCGIRSNIAEHYENITNIIFCIVTFVMLLSNFYVTLLLCYRIHPLHAQSH